MPALASLPLHNCPFTCACIALYRSSANVYMPDFEDSNCPTWDNMVQGQVGARARPPACLLHRG